MNIIRLHQQAEKLREQEKFLEALKTYDDVIIAYCQTNDNINVANALLGRCLTYKHLFLKSKNINFAIIARSDAESSLEICQKNYLNDYLFRCYFRLGEMEMLFNNFSKAVKYYQQAIIKYPKEDAEKGDFLYHLGEAQYLNNDIESGLNNLKKGLKMIRQYASATDSFLIHVWESGVLMKLAFLLKDEKYLAEAQKIILSDDRLIIRKRQLEELKKSLTG